MEWTSIIGGAINAAINGIAVFLAVRYVGKVADRIDKKNKDKKND